MTDYHLLFSRTMTVLLAMVGISYGGTLLTWDWIPTQGEMIFVAVIWFVSLFGVMAAAGRHNNPSAIIPAAIFSLIGGCFVGPTISMYHEVIGPAQVNLALAMCGGVLVGTGMISYLVNIAYAKLEGVLMIGLLGLIGYQIFDMFMAIDPAIDLTVAYIGVGIFTLFTLVDFLRLKDDAVMGHTGWGTAVSLAVNMYLDLLNLLLYILQIMAASKD